ncbi:MAG TPA: YhcN/YlaJ family sporulation lipoprotein [Bacillales bacterium]|nr:YhcN/YlaJ family sporulation lipoprotein [Bacillales bacterium]HEU5139712.1 YhcN/YlaJ family sporulation lipoprotein [Bacillales bacterium]
MKKSIFSLSAAFLLTGALAGCGADNGAVGDNDGVRPIGYYSDENTDDNDWGMNRNRNHNGMLDNNNNGALGNRNDNLGYNNGDGLNNDTDNDLGLGNNNNNNNGKIDDGNNNGMGMMNGDNHHERQAQAIANKLADMKNIENTSVVVTDDNVLVGIKTNDRGVTKHLKSSVRKTVQGMVQGKDIHVATSPRMYNRIKNVNNNLQDGDGLNEVNSDVRGIINDLGDAVKRPFQNNNNQ